MAVQLEWDKFEAALLIAGAEQVMNNPSAKKEVVKNLSHALRHRAINRGIRIDNVFRNTNGISLQMTKVIYLLSAGDMGLPGASKIFADMVALKKDNPSEFAEILTIAQQQVTNDDFEVFESTKDTFIHWLNKIPNKKFRTETIIEALEEGSKYSMVRGLCKKCFWDITDIILFSSVSAALQGMKIFRFTHKSIVPALDYGIALYKDYLRQYKDVLTIHSSKPKEDDKPESSSPLTKPSQERPDSTANNETAIDSQHPTNETDKAMKKAETTSEAKTSSKLEDKDTLEDRIYISLKKECEKNPYGATLAFIARQVNASEKEVKSILSQVEWALFRYGKYTISDNDSGEYQTYDFYKNPSLSFTKPIKALYFDEVVSQAPTWRQLYLDFLKVLYEDYPHIFQGIIGKIFPRFSSPLVGDETHITQYRKPGEFATELYVETNISAHDTVANLKKFLELCNVDYENVKIIYERKSTADYEKESTKNVTDKIHSLSSDINFSRMHKSLKTTLEYLQKRYKVRLSYNHFDDPKSHSNDMLYKVNNGKKDIIWVYFLYSQRSRYISIETEPEYLKNNSNLSAGFTKTMLRASHPCLKMFFERYESISASLVTICDSIDAYFEHEISHTKATSINEPSANQVKLYQKLYSISKVYDDPNGISVDRIMRMITLDVSDAVVIDLLDRVSWATKLSDGVYSFARTATPKTQPKQQPKPQPKATVVPSSTEKISEDAFYRYLRYDAKKAESTCRGYVSAIHSVDSFAKKKHYINQSLLNSTPQQIISVIGQLEQDPDFTDYNRKQHNRFSAALAKLSSFVTRGGNLQPSAVPQRKPKVKEESVCPSDFDKDKYIAVLMRRYNSGMKFDSIDFENFRDMYFDMYDEDIAFDDDELKKRLLFCGVYYKDRLFPADGIIDSDTSKKLFQYIEKTFASGKTVIYYKAILSDMADDFVYCFNLTGEDMLRAYLEYTAPKAKYYFHKDYISTEKEIKVDHTAEIVSYLLSVGKPLKMDEICAGLPHISADVVKDVVRNDNDFFWDAKGYYFHMDCFEASDDELEQISRFIADEIEKEGYALWPRIYDCIVEEMPIFLENNAYLSSLGIRNAVSRKLSHVYSFESAIISTKASPLDTSGVFKMYAKHHRTFTADDVYQFAKEFGSVIYYDALAEESIRVNKDLFVAKDMVFFDVDVIDYAISTFFSGEYILMKDMDSFLVFPVIGYPWNQFLLESFIHGYSRNYKLINNGYSRNIVPGAIVKMDSHLNEFVDVVAAVLADSSIELKETAAISFLVENNLIVNKRYGDIGRALEKARRIRNRKG